MRLTDRLRAASAGHVAAYGDAAPNLFAEALAEIEHLRKIEDASRRLNEPFPFRDEKHWENMRPRDLAALVKERSETAAALLGLIREQGGRP